MNAPLPATDFRANVTKWKPDFGFQALSLFRPLPKQDWRPFTSTVSREVRRDTLEARTKGGAKLAANAN